jgi:hypothetical protein
MPEQMIMPSIFGAGCGWQYDIWPTFPSNGQIQIREAQAIDYDFWVYDANADGIFEDTKAGSICYGPNCGRSFGRIVTVGI